MTVNSTTITSGPYVGNDIADTFSYTFKVEDKTQLSVYETTDLGVETLLVVDTHYTVNNVGNDSGGTILRIAGALPQDYEWYIRSDYDETQLTAFQSQGAFFPDLHENAMDKLTFLIQQILDTQKRTPTLSRSYTGPIPLTLDNPIAGQGLLWKDDLTGLENIDLFTTFLERAGDSMAGPLSMAGNPLTNLPPGVAGSDPATITQMNLSSATGEVGDLIAVARSNNVNNSDVIDESNTDDPIPLIVYASSQGKSYSVPSDAQGKFIDFVSGSTLHTTVGGPYQLIDLEYEIQTAADFAGKTFSFGASVSTKGFYEVNDPGAADYFISVADSAKITAGIQLATVGMLAAELRSANDILIDKIGALASSTQDVTTILQPYIDYFKDTGNALKLKLGLRTYYCHTGIDLLNIGNNNSVSIIGVQKSRINSQGTGSILYGNTGNNNPVILVAGTENVNLKGFSIFSAVSGSLLSPSTLGIVLARTATKTFCQFINLSKIHIDLVTIPTVNNNYGSIGIYNYASETHEWHDVSIAADSPMIMTTSDVVDISSWMGADYFDNTGTESQNTTTNFDYTNLQLYPKTNSPIILDIVRDLNIDTLLAFADSDLLKYLVEFEGILPNRRIKISNIHTEKIRRGFRIDNPLLESSFEGKLGTGITDKMAFVLNDGRMSQVEFACFNSSSGTVTMIDDATSNESFDVTVKVLRETNTADVLFDYDLGTAKYNNLKIYTDNQINTTDASIISLQANIITIYGTDGIYERGTYFQGTTAQRPTTGLYDGKRYYDKDLNKPVWWNGSNWRDAAGVVA